MDPQSSSSAGKPSSYSAKLSFLGKVVCGKRDCSDLRYFLLPEDPSNEPLFHGLPEEDADDADDADDNSEINLSRRSLENITKNSAGLSVETQTSVEIDSKHIDAAVLDESSTSFPWLDKCKVAASPSGRCIAFARGPRIAVVRGNSNLENVNENIWKLSGKAENKNSNEIFTSVACLEFSHKARGDGDRFCVVAGTNHGSIRVYYASEGCERIITQTLHKGPVMRIRQQPGHSGSSMHDLAVLYPCNVAVIDGFSLLQYIRACINSLTRGQSIDSLEMPMLQFKKWRLQDHRVTLDIACTGLRIPCSYDNICLATDVDYKARLKETEPVSRYIVVGHHPMIGYYHTLGCDRPFFSVSALASSMASKLTTAAFSVMNSLWGKTANKQDTSSTDHDDNMPEVAKNDGAPLPLEFSMDADPRRQVKSISLCPRCELAVTTDGFGRVMLLDANQGLILRMWKGYRDAQCAWVLSKEIAEKLSSPPRRCMFLAIYAPWRGIVEVWGLRYGARIGAFNVGKDCRLVSFGEQKTLGGNSIKNANTYSCVLLRGDGAILKIDVPFVCALESSLSTKMKDKMVVEKIIPLMTNTGSDEYLRELFVQLRTSGAVLEVANRLGSDYVPDDVGMMVWNLIVVASDSFNRENPTREDRQLWELVKIRKLQGKGYEALSLMCKAGDGISSHVDYKNCDVDLVKEIDVSIDRIFGERSMPTSPFEKFSLSKVDFWRCFNINFKDSISTAIIELKRSLPDKELDSLCNHYCGCIASDFCDAENLVSSWRLCGGSTLNSLAIIIRWCFKQRSYILLHPKVSENLQSVMSYLLSSLDPDESELISEFLMGRCADTCSIEQALIISTIIHRFLQSNKHKNLWTNFFVRLRGAAALRAAIYNHNEDQNDFKISICELLVSDNLKNAIVSFVLNSGERAYEFFSGDESPMSLQLMSLQKHFPVLTDFNVLAGNCAIELQKRWENAPDTFDNSYLKGALKFAGSIKDSPCAVAALVGMWKESEERFHKLNALVEKVGKAPKERLLVKHIGITRKTTIFFLIHLETILHSMLFALGKIISCEDNNIEGSEIPKEASWSNVSESSDKACFLQWLTVSEAEAHLTRCRLLQVIMCVNMSGFRPSSLLGSSETTQNQEEMNANQSVFLKCALAAILGNLFDCELSTEKVYELGKEFKINHDELLQQEVCNLFEINRDAAAYELFPSIQEKTELAFKLLNVGRRRLMAKIKWVDFS
eukprot:UC4_evm5s1353